MSHLSQPRAGDIAIAPDRSTVYRIPPRPRRLLGIWAHPDDESYLSAGLMDRTIRAGGHVTIVALTDGEAGFPADDPRSTRRRRRQRRAELTAAMAAIGVHDVRFLGLPDGGLAEQPEQRVQRSLRALIADICPDVVVTFGPDGITGHDDHVACSRLVTEAWLDRPSGELWYAAKTNGWLDEWRDLHDRFGVWMTEEPTGVDADDLELVIDLGGAALDRKRRVLGEHRSQTAAIAEAMGEEQYRRWIAQESFRWPTAAEVGIAADGRELLEAVAS